MVKRKQRGKQKGNKQKVIFVEMDEWENGKWTNGKMRKWEGSRGEKNISAQL